MHFDVYINISNVQIMENIVAYKLVHYRVTSAIKGTIGA